MLWLIAQGRFSIHFGLGWRAPPLSTYREQTTPLYPVPIRLASVPTRTVRAASATADFAPSPTSSLLLST